MEHGRIRPGWAVLAVVALVAFVATFVGTAWAIVTKAGDVGAGALLVAAAEGAVVLVFWSWIAGGAWRRATLPARFHQIRLLDPPPAGADPAVPPAKAVVPGRVGPWGWVGRVLLGALVAGFAALLVVGTLSTRHDRQRAERVQRTVERVAPARHLTVARVQEARSLAAVQPDALDRLLPIPGASIVDVDASATRAALLIRPDGGTPCVVLYVERRGRTHTEITDHCT